MRIRKATSLDQNDVRDTHWSAFTEDERDIVSKLAVNLLSENTTPQTVSLVAESEGMIVGHVAFSPVTMGNDEDFLGYILGPLGVKPDYQKRGIGSKLVESGIRELSELGIDIIFVYGDPQYYGKFGFTEDAAKPYAPPYELQYPFGWQGIALNRHSAEKPSAKITCVSSLSDPALW